MSRVSISGILALIGCFTSSPGWACQVMATGVTLGVYETIAPSTVVGTGTIRVTCPQPAVIRLSAGQHSQGEFSHRTLRADIEATQLRYNLYLDPTLLRVWGDGAADTFVQEVPAGTSHLTIYAVVPDGQRVSPGVLNDMITVIAEW
jgi:spore coat protein U-like protein